MNTNTNNALSGSMNDKVAPSEADMAERLKSAEQTTTPQNAVTDTTASYVDALTRGMETTADAKQSKS